MLSGLIHQGGVNLADPASMLIDPDAVVTNQPLNRRNYIKRKQPESEFRLWLLLVNNLIDPPTSIGHYGL